ncbi:MAG: serine/threonine protein phosphatase PrpC, partial [Myxococcota bacterium]
TATAGSGDVASGITVQVVANLWEQALPRLREAPGSEIQDFMSRALRVANQAVCEAALRFAGGRLDGQVPMGTTCVMAVTRGADVWLCWLGDSRAYLIGQGQASLLSADQNQAGDRLRAWQAGIDPKWDPAGFALVGYIGHFNDWGRPEALPPSQFQTRLLPGERLLLCSDGVSDYVAENHPAVAECLGRASALGTCDEISRRLIRLANEAGGGDNCSVVIAAHP